MGSVAARSSTVTSPSASPSATLTAGSRGTVARMRFRASSRGITVLDVTEAAPPFEPSGPKIRILRFPPFVPSAPAGGNRTEERRMTLSQPKPGGQMRRKFFMLAAAVLAALPPAIAAAGHGDRSPSAAEAAAFPTELASSAKLTFPLPDPPGPPPPAPGVDFTHPDLAPAMKANVKLAGFGQDPVPTVPIAGIPNSDTSSGHGTHVAGDVAGRGTASHGEQKGMAYGADLVGIGTGDALSVFTALEGFNWLLERS